MDNQKLSKLTDNARIKAFNTIMDLESNAELKKLGVEEIYISETKRELSTQMAYFSRGRMSVENVRAMYKAAGLYALSDQEAKTPNTWTLSSKHLEGKAIDLVPVIKGKARWTKPEDMTAEDFKKIWEIIGSTGEKNGFTWGGRWAEPDLPHFQVN